MHSVFVAWQDSASRQWHTIARLSRASDGQYEFGFTRGAEKLRDVTRQLFNLHLDGHYYSTELSALFRNKIPPRSRVDFKKMANWLNLKGDESDFELLGKFGLIPGTDSLLVYPAPTVVHGNYSIEFFIHGTRHAHGTAQNRHLHGDVMTWCDLARAGDRLCPMLDVQNVGDPEAVALRAENGTVIVGYVPRFYAQDLRSILGQPKLANSARIELLRNNSDAPLQFRMLCRFTSDVSLEFKPLNDADHEMWPTLMPLVS